MPEAQRAQPERVFCPLKARWFDLIKAGRKRWEFRSASSPVARQALSMFTPGSRLPIELRRGYRGEVLWKLITEIRVFQGSLEVPPEVLGEGCASEEELRELSILGPIVALHLDDPTHEELEELNGPIEFKTAFELGAPREPYRDGPNSACRPRKPQLNHEQSVKEWDGPGFSCPTCGTPLEFVVEKVGTPFEFISDEDSTPLSFNMEEVTKEFTNSWRCPECRSSFTKTQLWKSSGRASPPADLAEPYPASTAGLGASKQRPPAQSGIFEFPYHYPLKRGSFTLPGLGEKGENCGARRLDLFSEDGKRAHYGILRCKRVECPVCWGDWARRTVFELALRIEAYARVHNKRPYLAIFSIPPSNVYGSKQRGWDWERVNTSLFRRGYRRAENQAGIDGGISVFHPYRIRKSWQRIFRAKLGKPRGLPAEDDEDVSYWKEIRARVQSGEPLTRFVKLGPHAHSILFGDPREHRCSDFLIRFKDNDQGNPIPLELQDVIGLLFYLITHTGVINHLKAYKKPRSGRRVIRKQVTHTIREWGVLFRFDPAKALPSDEFNTLASEIAEAIGMIWRNGGLSYPIRGKSKDFETTGDEIKWVSIYRLKDYLKDETWTSRLSPTQLEFWDEVLDFWFKNRRWPDIDEVKPPPDIETFVEEEPTDVHELAIHPSVIKAPLRCEWAKTTCTDEVASKCQLAGASVCARAKSFVDLMLESN